LQLRGIPRPDLPPLEASDGALSSSKRLEFSDKAFNTGITRQRGCTTVYIFSKKGMWEAHFWEIPAFEKAMEIQEVDGIFQVTRTQPSDELIFNQAVINFIANGDGTGKNIFRAHHIQLSC
jgi:hypothetical protein